MFSCFDLRVLALGNRIRALIGCNFLGWIIDIDRFNLSTAQILIVREVAPVANLAISLRYDQDHPIPFFNGARKEVLERVLGATVD